MGKHRAAIQMVDLYGKKGTSCDNIKKRAYKMPPVTLDGKGEANTLDFEYTRLVFPMEIVLAA
jgi:hypothetical protein